MNRLKIRRHISTIYIKKKLKSMRKKIIDTFLKKQSYQVTCDCCGHKTLYSNNIDEICTICFWKQDYFYPNDLFCLSSSNHMTLYQGQENFKNFVTCKKGFISEGQKIFNTVTKDENWVSIQDKIENNYNDSLIILNEISNICSKLKINQAESLFYNYKKLDESKCEEDELTSYYYLEKSDKSYIRLQQKLLLKALTKILIKKDLSCLEKQIILYYKRGIAYYVSWSIMLLTLISRAPQKFSDEVADLLLDIENNDYYGLKNLENELKKYWYNFGN